MAPTINEIEARLNRLYWTDNKAYVEHLNMVKGMGYKVFRNSKGTHKVQMDMSSAFGGLFSDIFK